MWERWSERWHTSDLGINTRTLWMLFIIFVLIGLLTGDGYSRNWWFGAFLLLWIIPAFARRSRTYDEKRKHEDSEGAETDLDKPKREPHYMLGDDGEMIEVIEDQPFREANDDAAKTMYV